MAHSDGSTSRRRLLALAPAAAAAALGAAGCTDDSGGAPGGTPTPSPSARVSAPPATGVLAANVNQNLDHIDVDQLAAASATWVRGFLTVTPGQVRPASDPGLARLLDAARRGYGTVLNLKFQYRNRPLPEPGTPAMRALLARLDAVLAATVGTVDILVIGNEPFFETRPADRTSPRINRCYETLARYAIGYRERHGGARTAIYLGALTALDDPAARTPQTRRWLTFAYRTEGIAGVDIHPHVGAPDRVQRYLDYMLPALRGDQRFLATEFSLVLLWKRHLSDPVDAGWADRHRMPAGTPMWQAIAAAIHHPVGERAWTDLLLSAPWYADHKRFLADQTARFRATGRLAVAAYGISQDRAMTRHVGPHSHPWLLNALFCPETCTPQRNGLPGRNLTWYDEFRAAQRG